MTHFDRAVFRECSNPACLLRYPDLDNHRLQSTCPLCGAAATATHEINLQRNERPPAMEMRPVEILCVLDNIRSVHNVGSMFRTMSGFGVKHAYLCGITPNPTHQQFTKTSMGAEIEIEWQVANNAVKICQELKSDGCFIVCLESCASSTPIQEVCLPANDKRIALIIGNEISGIDPALLMLSDLILSIPVKGKNKSYNVAVAFGIGLYACFNAAV